MSQKLKSLSPLPRMVLFQVMLRLGYGKKVLAKGMSNLMAHMTNSQAFAGYEPTEHDVFAATYAKSGTNWSMQITQQIACLGQAEFEHIHHLVAWPDAPMWPMGDGAVTIAPLNDTTVQAKSPTGLRVIKTHLPAHSVPYGTKATYLSIIRDPKEVCVSAYYFMGGIMNFAGHLSKSDWVDLCLTPGGLLSGWADHTASFWAWRERPNVLVLTFKEMKADTPQAIARIAELMGVTLTEAQFAEVVERSSFAYMKARDEKFAPLRPPSMGKKPVKMMRQGKSGASGEVLSEAQQVAIDQFCEAELQKLGSDFPYAMYTTKGHILKA
jgi:hypothetical protein